jgi:hypothetical protein
MGYRAWTNIQEGAGRQSLLPGYMIDGFVSKARPERYSSLISERKKYPAKEEIPLDKYAGRR